MNCYHIMENTHHYENLVLKGGGIKGFAYIGAFKALNDLNKLKHIKKVIGTSAGSMFALLIACKFTNDEIAECVSKFFSEITQLDESIFSEGMNLIKKNGIHDNTNIYNSINQILFDKFGIENMTMKQLFEKTDIELTVVGTCLSTHRCVYFNHVTYPDIEIAKSIQISTAIPIFFTEVIWNDLTWADGGIVENFPIRFYDEYKSDLTLGLYLQSSDIKKIYETDTLLSLLEGIEETQLEHTEYESMHDLKHRNIISIDTGTISAINFKISNDDKNFLIKNAYDSVISFFENEQKILNEKMSWGNWIWSLLALQK